MNDADVRALQVKMLTEDQLRRLHAWEEENLMICHAAAVTEKFRLQPIKDHYGVATKRGTPARALHEWATRIADVLERFVRETGLRRYATDLVDLHAYDWGIFRSDLDFYYKTATPAKRATGWTGNHE